MVYTNVEYSKVLAGEYSVTWRARIKNIWWVIICKWCGTFSFSEAAPFLASTKNRGLRRMHRLFPLYSQPIRSVWFDKMSVNRGLPVLDLPRSRNYWCRPKERGHWGREWMLCIILCKSTHAQIFFTQMNSWKVELLFQTWRFIVHKIFLSIDCYISTTIKFISLLHTHRLYKERAVVQWLVSGGIP